jgi:hypothetical protein
VCQRRGRALVIAGPAWPRALPPGVHAVNEGLAFALELVALGFLAWWGADTGGGLAAAAVFAIGRHGLAIAFAVVVIINTAWPPPTARP